MTDTRPEIECPKCEGTGTIQTPYSGVREFAPCPVCKGTGLRPMTDEEWSDWMTMTFQYGAPYSKRASEAKLTSKKVLADMLAALTVRTEVVNVDTGETGRKEVVIPLRMRDELLAVLRDDLKEVN